MNRANAASQPGSWLEGFDVDFGGALQFDEHVLTSHPITSVVRQACVVH